MSRNEVYPREMPTCRGCAALRSALSRNERLSEAMKIPRRTKRSVFLRALRPWERRRPRLLDSTISFLMEQSRRGRLRSQGSQRSMDMSHYGAFETLKIGGERRA